MSFITVIPEAAFIANSTPGDYCAERSSLRQYEPIGETFHMARPRGEDLVFSFTKHIMWGNEIGGWQFANASGATVTIFND